jgi:hypothetical protein
MAIFSNTPATDAFVAEMLSPATSYANAASYSAPVNARPGLSPYNGYNRPTASSAMETPPGTAIAKEIAQMKTTIANLQNKPKLPHNNDKTTNPVTPNIMQMFQKLHESMEDSKSAMTNFRQSLESKVHTIESNIQEIQQAHQISNTTVKNFQAEVNLALRSLRTENNALQARLDGLAQKPVASPRRKKLKDAHKSTPLAKATLETTSPVSATTTVTFQQTSSPHDSDAPTVSFLNPNEDNTMDSEDDSDEDTAMLTDHTNLADQDDADPLNRTKAMHTDPASPAKDS